MTLTRSEMFHRELGDSAIVYRCHLVLGLLHQKERHTSLALGSFQAALTVARQLRDRGKEAGALKEIAQVCTMWSCYV